MRNIVDLMFLRIRLGGMGMQSTRISAIHAFVGSMTQNLHTVKKFSHDIDDIGSAAYETPEMREFRSLIEQLREEGHEGISETDLAEVYTKPMLKMQRKLADHHQQKLMDRISERMPSQAPSAGFNIRQLNEDERSRKHQTLANRDSTASAFMVANPGTHMMNDKTFCYTSAIRMGVDINGSRKFCVCGKKLDPFGNHSHVCKVKKVSTYEKHMNHNELNSYCQRIMRRVDSSFSVPKGEPIMNDYLERKQDGEGNESAVNHRGDFIMIPNDGSTPTIYDVTATSPIADRNNKPSMENALKPGAAAELAAQRKEEHYKKQYVLNSQRFMVKVAAMETTGGMSKDLRELIKMVAKEIVKKRVTVFSRSYDEFPDPRN